VDARRSSQRQQNREREARNSFHPVCSETH
jgi:hypothetical protein